MTCKILTYIYRLAALLGWTGLLIITPGLLECDTPVVVVAATGALSLALAWWGSYYAGLMWEKPHPLRLTSRKENAS